MLTPDKPFRGYTTRELHKCAEREAGYRRHVYEKRVAAGKLSRQTADRERDMMEAIAEHFAALAEKERLL